MHVRTFVSVFVFTLAYGQLFFKQLLTPILTQAFAIWFIYVLS